MISDAKKLQELFSDLHSNLIKIDYDKGNIWITLKYQETKQILSQCQVLFDPDNNIEIDRKEYVPDFDHLPPEGIEIQILTSLSKMKNAHILIAKNIESCQNHYVQEMIAADKKIDLDCWYFLIGESLFSQIPIELENAQICFSVFQHLRNIADHIYSGMFVFLCGPAVLEIPNDFLSTYVTELQKLESFVLINFKEAQPELKIFKSVLYENLSKVDKKDRLQKFFSCFDTIIQEFIVSCNIYYENYSLYQLKRELDETCITLNEKIKMSVENVKGELLLIITMAFAVSQFDYHWGESNIKNIIIIASILLASIIYTFLINYDRSNLADLELIVEAEETRLKIIGVDDKQKSEKFAMISKDVGRLRKSISSHKCFLILCIVAIWIPILILVVGLFLKIPGKT